MLKVVKLPVAVPVAYVENARNHSEEQVAQIAASIQQFGFVNPVLVDASGVLVAGHSRVMAAKRLVSPAVPAIRLAHLTDAQARALRLADNQIALNSGWDEALLAAEISRIRDEAVVDLDVLGSSAESLEQLPAQVSGATVPARRAATRGRSPRRWWAGRRRKDAPRCSVGHRGRVGGRRG